MSGWARPILAAAAVLVALLGGADALLRGSASTAPARLGEARRLALLSEASVAHGRAPSGAELRTILRKPDAMSWAARRTAVILLLAVFLAGGAAGWLLEDVVDDIDWPGSHRDGSTLDRPDEDEPLDDDAEEDFLETLGLSQTQLDSVDHLLEGREDRLEDYWKSRLPDLQALLDSSRREIRALLTPEQRAAYDRWLGAQSGPKQPSGGAR